MSRNPGRSQRQAGELPQDTVADNLYDLFRAMCQLPGAEIEQHDHLSRHCAAPGNPMFKGIWRPRLDAQNADAAIRDSVNWFQRRQAPFAFCWIDQQATPSDLAARLSNHGFAPWELNAPAMTAALDDLSYDAIQRAPAGYAQERVHDLKGLNDFKLAFVAGNAVPEWAGSAWVDATLAFGIDRAPWRCYVGRLDGQPVASALLYAEADVAALYGVAVAPAARGRGIGAAITLLACADARQAGYRRGALFASELGLPVYRRIGFRETGGAISRYLWRAG